MNQIGPTSATLLRTIVDFPQDSQALVQILHEEHETEPKTTRRIIASLVKRGLIKLTQIAVGSGQRFIATKKGREAIAGIYHF